MSSIVIAGTVSVSAEDNEISEAVAEEKKSLRRFPPPCWTQEETLVLIGTYRERWYSARRGYLRTADWDSVAEVVAERCPSVSPAKTSAQCRHKMEKLRQRYRAEKQRAEAFSCPGGRYIPSWFFFENMESMENGTEPPAPWQKLDNPTDGSQLNKHLEQNLLKFKLKAKNYPESSPELGFDNSVHDMRLNFATKASIEYYPYLDTQIAYRHKEGTPDSLNRGFKIHPANIIPISIPPLKSVSENSSKLLNNDFAAGDGFHQQLPPSGLRTNRLESDYSPNNFVDPGNRIKYWSVKNPNSDPRSSTRGFKRGRNELEEITTSIRQLAESFVRVEREKMEMAREMEGMRMEMEMKRHQMLLESQKEVVNAFLKGLFELKNIKKKLKSGDEP